MTAEEQNKFMKKINRELWFIQYVWPFVAIPLAVVVSYGLALAGEPRSAWLWSLVGVL